MNEEWKDHLKHLPNSEFGKEIKLDQTFEGKEHPGNDGFFGVYGKK